MKSVHIGEALIDFSSIGEMRYQGRCGGSPMNTAIAVARLGQPTGYITQLSTDMFGERLRQHIIANGLDTRFLLSHPAPTTLAFVEHGEHGNRYQFLANGSADFLYAPDPLPNLPPDVAFLQFGSVSLLFEPSSSAITRLVAKHRGRMIVVLDPNVRPTLIPDRDDYCRRFRGWLPLCHILKLSDEDAEKLCVGPMDDEIEQWLALGPKVVFLTRGAHGARVYVRGQSPIETSAPKVTVADTVGAGDTFTAGLIAGLLERGVNQSAQLDEMRSKDWHELLHFAACAAALCCTREGAAPPTRAELADFLTGAKTA